VGANEPQEGKSGAAAPARFDFLFEEWLFNTLAVTFPASDRVRAFHPCISFMHFYFKELLSFVLESRGRQAMKGRKGRKCQACVTTPQPPTRPDAVQAKGSSTIFQPPGKTPN
jgi:hypothetical protein